MKTRTASALVSLCILSGTFKTHAKVFTCSGIVTNVISKYDQFEVRYKSAQTGEQMAPIWIYETHAYLLGPVLKAIEAGKKFNTEYMLVLENRASDDILCMAGHALIAITKK
ncbi:MULTISPECIES: hypothetical protein [Pseudoalteromonas]|uniref:Uncharacterized protein n=1 Tax=Pseudoalteromonas luteoviolacea (strain 2ta16) TaxID=1353533 RepID=V4HV42_PSEL2|nr:MULTISPECIES: hypothetical protein [Pseudoalteromonas]ESP93663.1 hypothetical protein PL2TA16_03049 [Pseudoalteromonas luteoviolacea 2ta16]KZN42453.1 hypothetical protein N483_13105 [Pseudoalteromonas luteoviolacea NCIMB 1944]MCG7547057.1 hypothetical protein [Pseudoalteromonas sp. Of7M-16]